MRPTSTHTFDYRDLLRRDDPSARPRHVDITDLGRPDLHAAATAGFTGELPVVAGLWRAAAPDDATLAVMLRVLAAFTEAARDAGHHSFADVTPATVRRFVRAEAADPGAVWALRKNAVHAAYLALAQARWGTACPAAGIDAAPPGRTRRPAPAKKKGKRKAYADATHTRTVTNDEMLLLRIAARRAGSSRARHLPAAAVAVQSATAASREAAHVLWANVVAGTNPPRLHLGGNHDLRGNPDLHIAPRVVSLDDWQATSLDAWREECSAHRSLHPQAPMFYTGLQTLDSKAALVCVTQQVHKALVVADLHTLPGVVPESLRLWGAARGARDRAAAEAGAARAGISVWALHRLLRHVSTRPTLGA